MVDKERLFCVLVDHGMMRHKEVEQIEATCKTLDIPLTTVDASEAFLTKLSGVTDPEQKRKIVGACFIDTFQAAIDTIKKGKGDTDTGAQWMLAQGTIASDVIESSKASSGGTQQVIKSHHNVGGLPEKFGLKLVEPLRTMFKNEVRDIGRMIGLPADVIQRKPFPGPGLSIRILGEITKEKIATVQEADRIFTTMIREKGYHDKIDQYYAALLDSKSVAVVGDTRRYAYIVALRAINSKDFMTATAFEFSHKFLEDVSSKIINGISNVSRVMYDVTSKPPGTVEME
jgi:GMP synthase (glutamine-hydrolysing)